ncbi:hypothetical protein C4B60_07325 [Jeotgalibacillus proteolyticus]|uniref:Uncharacterized protein n=1 Tax=Jeotgalibacillus proteolyticus TaxID=2082395 RepID=A0A2S5GCG5_9BACL|nr:hypothetical protein C4B60_07325 [Jeotgalibacillus proteolyticus]
MRKRSKGSSWEACINVLFTLIYIGYWWVIFQQIFYGNTFLIYICIIPFIILLYLQSLCITFIENRREKKLVLSLEKTLKRYGADRVKF